MINDEDKNEFVPVKRDLTGDGLSNTTRLKRGVSSVGHKAAPEVNGCSHVREIPRDKIKLGISCHRISNSK
jgi:hypothetical protein